MLNALPARILVVDDDETMRSLLALRLGMLGHDVHTGASVAEAIVTLEVVTVDAIVSGQRMAGGTGLDLLAYVRRRWPELPSSSRAAPSTTSSRRSHTPPAPTGSTRSPTCRRRCPSSSPPSASGLRRSRRSQRDEGRGAALVSLESSHAPLH
jgi:CheY-like chemotaxis protein